jgi:hypothetical protein
VVRDARVGEPVAAIEDRLPDVILVRGTTVHINQIKHGRVGDRYTGVVITDDGDHLVLQAVRLHENDLGVARIEPGDVATEHYWRSRFFSIWEVHGPAGLRGWYCNVARPAILVGGAVQGRDLELDVWISANWTKHVILDEDEFEASPLIAGHSRAGRRGAARSPISLGAHAATATRALGDFADRPRRQALPRSSNMTTCS